METGAVITNPSTVNIQDLIPTLAENTKQYNKPK